MVDTGKIPKELESETDIIKWMRFMNGKSRKEFEDMAKTDEYLDEACRELERMSADEQAKLEYEARERAIRDYNSQMSSALRRGREEGMKRGVEKGMEKARQSMIIEMLSNGMSADEICRMAGATEEEIRKAKEAMES